MTTIEARRTHSPLRTGAGSGGVAASGAPVSGTATSTTSGAAIDRFASGGAGEIPMRAGAGARAGLQGLSPGQRVGAGAMAALAGLGALAGCASMPNGESGFNQPATQIVDLRASPQSAERPLLRNADGTWRLNPAFLNAQAPTLRATFDTLPADGAGPAQALLLADNLDAWNARWEVLESAKTSIDASYFTVSRDAFGHAFLGHLLKKQMAGVDVRLSIDAMADAMGRNFKWAGRDYLQELSARGADVRIFHPITQRLPQLNTHAGLAQNHDKILVVDGRFGITGGRNIGHEYFAHPADLSTAWRDTDVLLDGAGAARGLSHALDQEIDDVSLAPRVPRDLLGNLVSREGELLGSYAMMDGFLKGPALSDAHKQSLRTDPAARDQYADKLVAMAAARLPGEGHKAPLTSSERDALKEIALQLAAQPEMAGSRARYQAMATRHAVEARILDRTSASDPEVNDFTTALIRLAEASTKKLTIQNPYVVLTEPMVQALERAAKRGVEIEIVTNSPASTDSAITQAFFLKDWPTVLARVPTARIFVFTGERKMHAKVAVADDDVTLVSTFNMDLLSARINGEVGALMWSREMATALRDTIAADRNDPKNGLLEYTIARTSTGAPRLDHGKPVVTQGPASHLSREVLDKYARLSGFANWARYHLDQLEGLRLAPAHE